MPLPRASHSQCLAFILYPYYIPTHCDAHADVLRFCVPLRFSSIKVRPPLRSYSDPPTICFIQEMILKVCTVFCRCCCFVHRRTRAPWPFNCLHQRCRTPPSPAWSWPRHLRWIGFYAAIHHQHHHSPLPVALLQQSQLKEPKLSLPLPPPPSARPMPLRARMKRRRQRQG